MVGTMWTSAGLDLTAGAISGMASPAAVPGSEATLGTGWSKTAASGAPGEGTSPERLPPGDGGTRKPGDGGAEPPGSEPGDGGTALMLGRAGVIGATLPPAKGMNPGVPGKLPPGVRVPPGNPGVTGATLPPGMGKKPGVPGSADGVIGITPGVIGATLPPAKGMKPGVPGMSPMPGVAGAGPRGVYGATPPSTPPMPGVWGITGPRGVYGAAPPSIGVCGAAPPGVIGIAPMGALGVYGCTPPRPGVRGAGPRGVNGANPRGRDTGVCGTTGPPSGGADGRGV